MYGRANNNGREATRLYREQFPHRQQSSYRIFSAAYRRLCETGSLLPPRVDGGRPRHVRTPPLEERALQSVENDPDI